MKFIRLIYYTIKYWWQGDTLEMAIMFAKKVVYWE